MEPSVVSATSSPGYSAPSVVTMALSEEIETRSLSSARPRADSHSATDATSRLEPPPRAAGHGDPAPATGPTSGEDPSVKAEPAGDGPTAAAAAADPDPSTPARRPGARAEPQATGRGPAPRVQVYAGKHVPPTPVGTPAGVMFGAVGGKAAAGQTKFTPIRSLLRAGTSSGTAGPASGPPSGGSTSSHASAPKSEDSAPPAVGYGDSGSSDAGPGRRRTRRARPSSAKGHGNGADIGASGDNEEHGMEEEEEEGKGEGGRSLRQVRRSLARVSCADGSDSGAEGTGWHTMDAASRLQQQLPLYRELALAMSGGTAATLQAASQGVVSWARDGVVSESTSKLARDEEGDGGDSLDGSGRAARDKGRARGTRAAAVASGFSSERAQGRAEVDRGQGAASTGDALRAELGLPVSGRAGARSRRRVGAQPTEAELDTMVEGVLLRGLSSEAHSGGGGGDACNCRRSQCLKLYCKCFANGRACHGACNCANCHNTDRHSGERRAATKAILRRNLYAFTPKILMQPGAGKAAAVAAGGSGNPAASAVTATHRRGCMCRRSRCLKKYCECFQSGVVCGPNCQCQECLNFAGSDALGDALRQRKGGARSKTVPAPAQAYPAAAAPSSSSSTSSVVAAPSLGDDAKDGHRSFRGRGARKATAQHSADGPTAAGPDANARRSRRQRRRPARLRDTEGERGEDEDEDEEDEGSGEARITARRPATARARVTGATAWDAGSRPTSRTHTEPASPPDASVRALMAAGRSREEAAAAAALINAASPRKRIRSGRDDAVAAQASPRKGPRVRRLFRSSSGGSAGASPLSSPQRSRLPLRDGVRAGGAGTDRLTLDRAYFDPGRAMASASEEGAGAGAAGSVGGAGGSEHSFAGARSRGDDGASLASPPRVAARARRTQAASFHSPDAHQGASALAVLADAVMFASPPATAPLGSQ